MNKIYNLVSGFLLILFLLSTGFTSYADEIDTSITKKIYDKGYLYYNNSQFDSSLYYYNLAKNRYQKEKNWLFYVNCMINSAMAYAGLNNIEKSNELFDLAEKTANELVFNDPKVKEAEKVYLKYSFAYSLRQYDKVVRYLEQYLQFKSSKYNLSHIYYTLGYCYYFLQDYENSNKAYFNAIKISTDNNRMNIQLSKIYSAIATNYYMINEYNNSIIYNDKAVEILKQANKNHPELVQIYITLSMVYFTKNDFNTAIFYLNSALNNENNKSQLQCIYRSLGRCCEKMNDFTKAENNYQKALEYAKTVVNNPAEKITILMFYGDLCKRQNNREKSLFFYNQALSLSLKDLGLKNYLTSKCYTSLAEFYLAEKNYLKTFQEYQSALISLDQLFYSMDIYTNPSKGKILSYSQYFIVLKSKADALREYYKTSHKQKDLEMSLETYQLLCYEIEKQRAGFMAKDDKSFITEKYNEIYSSSIQIAMQLYSITHNEMYKESALKLAEQNKSTLLLEQFNENDAKKFGRVPQSIREKEKTIRKDISNCEKMIYEELQKKNKNPKNKSYWESRLFEATTVADTLLRYIKYNYSGYHRLKYNPSDISSAEIQKMLSPKSAFIEYALAGPVMYIFVITKEKFEIIVQKPLTDQETEGFKKCFNLTQIPQGDTVLFHNYIQEAFGIYEKLMKPVEAFIGAKNELIIIPDEKLAMIPFEALLYSKDVAEDGYRHLPYLIRKYNIGYAQLATLFITPNLYKSDKPSLLAVAPEYGSTDFKKQPEINILRTRGYDLGPIPGVLDEMKCLEQIIGVKIFTSGNATEGIFKKLQRRFNILHLAMHAVVDYNNPMYSKLIFSKSDDAGEDGFLNMYELMNMDVGANLTVLSACNTGSGNFLKGEGIMNLARGFFYAGCQSVIMTLWAVDDNSGSKLINNFYKYFTTGKSKTESLRLAKLDFLEHSENQKTHPFFWAGYVNIGDSSPLFKKQNSNLIFFITGSVLLIISIVIFIKIRRRKKRKINYFNRDSDNAKQVRIEKYK